MKRAGFPDQVVHKKNPMNKAPLIANEEEFSQTFKPVKNPYKKDDRKGPSPKRVKQY